MIYLIEVDGTLPITTTDRHDLVERLARGQFGCPRCVAEVGKSGWRNVSHELARELIRRAMTEGWTLAPCAAAFAEQHYGGVR